MVNSKQIPHESLPAASKDLCGSGLAEGYRQ